MHEDYLYSASEPHIDMQTQKGYIPKKYYKHDNIHETIPRFL